MTRMIAGAMVILVLAGTRAAGAQTPEAPLPAGFSPLPAVPMSPQIPGEVPGTVVYDNTGAAAQYFYSAQHGALAIDDVRLEMQGHAPGILTRIAFEVFEPTEGGEPFTAYVTVYDNPGGADAVLPLIGGPYPVTGIGSGRTLVDVPVVDGPVVGPYMWVGIRFTSSTAGLVINSTPTVGASHDYYVQNGTFYYFGGNPRANFSLRVTANLPPLPLADSFTTDEDAVLGTAAPGVLANDTDLEGDPMTASVASGPDHGSLYLDLDGAFTYTPDPDFNGTDTFTYLAGDGGSESGTCLVTLIVLPVNDPPVALEDRATTLEDTPVHTVNVLANDHDVDGDMLSVVGFDEVTDAGGTVGSESEGAFLYTPPPDFNGIDLFHYSVGDGMGAVSLGTVRLDVLPVNDAPVAVDDAYTTDEDVVLSIGAPGVLGNDLDVDGDALEAALDSGPAHGSVTLNPDGSFVYAPALDYSGPDSFRYVAQDTSLSSSPATVALTVNEGNEPPIALCRDTTVIADEDGIAQAEIDDGSCDPQGEAITLQQIPPGPYPVGAHLVALVVTDSQGGADTCTATVTVLDTMPPTVTCSARPLPKVKNLTPVEGVGEEFEDDPESRYLKDTYVLTFDAWDNSGQVDVTGGVDAGCDTIAIDSGQVVRLKFKKDKADTLRCRVEAKLKKDDISVIKGLSTARLVVLAVDGSGNTATCELDLESTKTKNKENKDDNNEDNPPSSPGVSPAVCRMGGAVVSAAPDFESASRIAFRTSGREGPAWRILEDLDGSTGTGLVAYDNLASIGGSPPFYSGQAGEEAIDDLHGQALGTLVELAFEYVDPVADGSFDAFVTLYDNPNGADTDARKLAGPYRIPALSEGRHVVSVGVVGGPEIGPDMWMGVRFASASAGLVINEDPGVGNSHDYYLQNGSLYFFGGSPVANFALRVTVAPSPTSVGGGIPEPLRLHACRPNPFFSRTRIFYDLPRVSAVRIDVFDSQGRFITTLADRVEEPGRHVVSWDGRDARENSVGAGLYFVRLLSEGSTRVQRIVRLSR